MTDTQVEDPAQAFAALMSGAAEAAGAGRDEEAPFGYTQDAQTGEMRPKRAKGRPRKSPGLDELIEQRATQMQDKGGSAGSAQPEGDRPPGAQGPKGGLEPKKADDSGVPYHPGRIARGMAKWYRRIGRFWRIYRPATGQAFIDCADDIGEAWEDVARGNPRIRKILNWIVTGGAWGALVLAHMPVFAAIILEHEERAQAAFERRERRRAADADAAGTVYRQREYRPFPLAKWMSAFVEDAYESAGDAAGDGGEGMSKSDVNDLMAVAGTMMQQMGFVHPDDLHPSQVPAAARPQPQDHNPPAHRVQPNRTTRAQRKKAA